MFSRFSADRAKLMLPFAENKICHVPLYFVHPPETSVPPEVADNLQVDVLVFGRFVGYKGIEEIGRIINELKRKTVVLAGRGASKVRKYLTSDADDRCNCIFGIRFQRSLF